MVTARSDRSVTPLLHRHRLAGGRFGRISFSGLLALLLAASPFAYGEEIAITGYDLHGMLEWTTAWPDISTFDVEWSGPLQDNTWHSSWDDLRDIPGTAATYRVRVPAFFRVRGHPHVRRSRWTLLYYMMADNDLEPDFFPKFEGLAQWNSDTNVQLIVQFAREGVIESHGKWKGSERFVITSGMTPTQENAVQDWGDGGGGRMLNPADPQSLADFLDWAMRLYPADHYALFIGSHGEGWKGFGVSHSYAHSRTFLPELGRVLREARHPVDLLMLDMCHMSMAETINELIGARVEYVMASQSQSLADWPYGWMLNELMGNPALAPRAFISDINERLGTNYSDRAALTLCTMDLSRAPAFISNTADFVAGVMDEGVPFPEVQQRAEAAMTALDNLFVVRCMGPHWDGIAYGLSVYFPTKKIAPESQNQSFEEYTARRSRFLLETGWHYMLAAYYEALAQPPPPFHSGQLDAIRTAITHYTDHLEENIDLYDFMRRFAEWESEE